MNGTYQFLVYADDKREEVAGGWRILHNEELHNFTLHEALLGWVSQGELDERSM
jgi:uncharacterized membrane protein YsdA (DUF1294 family)